MNRFFAALALGCALAAPLAPRVQAQTPGWTPAPLFASDQISQSTLPNGARVVVKSTPTRPSFRFKSGCAAAPRPEKPTEAGISHLIEVAAVNGSKNQPYVENGDEAGLSGAIRVVGGEAGSLTSRDATFYAATVATDDWGRALNALADTVLQPDLSAANINRAKLIIANQLVGQVFNPVSQATDLAYQTAYPNIPTAIPKSDRKTLWARFRPPRRAIFTSVNTLAGTSASSSSATWLHPTPLKRASAFLPRPAKRPRPLSRPLPSRCQLCAKLVCKRQLSATLWLWRGARQESKTRAMWWRLTLCCRCGAKVWTPICGAFYCAMGPKGENKPLVDSYDVDYLTQRDPGLILITLVGVQDRAETLSVIEKEIARLAKDGPGESEMQRARELLRRQYLEQSEGAAGQAGALGFYEMIADYKFALQYEQLTQTVTSADVQRIAREYLTPEKEIRASVTPLPRPRPGAPINPDDADGGDGVIMTRWLR